MEEMSHKLAQLHLAEKSAISLEKTDPEYILHVDSQSCTKCGSQARLAATSTNNTIRLYSRNDLAYTGTIEGHTKIITGLKFSNVDTNLIYSSSLDGTVRCWDLRESLTEAALTYEGYEETHNVFTAFDISSNDKLLCAGTEATKEDVFMLFWDRRKPGPVGCYSESHGDDITQVVFHPYHQDSLLTASTDGLVCVYDLSQPCEDDALQTSLNAESSVGKIGWCGPERSDIYCTTTIENFHIWNREYDMVTDIRDTREQLKVDYLLDCFMPTDNSRTRLIAGSHSGDLKAFKLDGNNLELEMTLKAGHTELVRCMTWDQENQTLVTGGEDAMLCLWKTGPPKSNMASNKSKHKLTSVSKVRAKMKKSVSDAAKPF